MDETTGRPAAGVGRHGGPGSAGAAGAFEECVAAILEQIRERQVRWVRVAAPDLHGVLRAKLVPALRFGEVLREGQPWGVRLLYVDLAEQLDTETAYDALTHFGNCRMLPDPATFRVLPWQPDTALVLADPILPDGRPAPTPRAGLRAVLATVAAAGYRVSAGSEIEFHLYRRLEGGLVPVTDQRAFFSARALAAAEPILAPLRQALTDLGLPVFSIENEHGAGQLELNLGPLEAMAAADAAALARASVKEVADRSGYLATFIAKPDNGKETNTCGYHLHQVLLDREGHNAFVAPGEEGDISATLRHFIAGQLDHVGALVACASPTITGYKRFQPGTFAPARASWGFDNRSVLLRVMRERGPNTRVENRLGEAAASPHLLLASQLAAGLAGIECRRDPGAPIDHDGNADASLPGLPRTVPEAVDALRADAALTAALGRDLVRAYSGALLSAWWRYQAHVTDWEVAEYRDVL